MFKKKKKVKTNITASNRIKGDLTSREDIVIDGVVIGKVSTSCNLEVKKTAQIKGNLNAENIIIAGIVEGDIKAKEKLEITETSKVFGNIDSKIFSLAAGAVFIGKCKSGEGDKTEIKEVLKEEDFENLTSNESLGVDLGGGKTKSSLTF